MAKHSSRVNAVIAEAHADGLRYSTALKRLRAGTLADDLGPIDMADRTFARRWGIVKREREAARGGNGSQRTEGELSRMHPFLVQWASEQIGEDDPERIAGCIRAMPERRDGPKTSLNPAYNKKLAATCRETTAAHVRKIQAIEAKAAAGGPPAESQIEAERTGFAASAATVEPA